VETFIESALLDAVHPHLEPTTAAAHREAASEYGDPDRFANGLTESGEAGKRRADSQPRMSVVPNIA
jgi:hypothetical protein